MRLRIDSSSNLFSPSYADTRIWKKAIGVNVANVIVHPHFNSSATISGGGIAIFHLNEAPNSLYYEKIDYKMTPSQVSDNYVAGKACTLTGWGK